MADILKYSGKRFSSVIFNSTKKYRPFLEIQTLGKNGLRYRLNKLSGWHYIPAFKTENLKDTCGCGDWTTAGIISKLCNAGLDYLIGKDKNSVEIALKYGQALGAWNCSFEGARTGMYTVNRTVFEREIKLILKEGVRRTKNDLQGIYNKYTTNGNCPACPHKIQTIITPFKNQRAAG